MPYVVHRALMGSFERFIGILTEHYAGAFPFWIAPVQIRIVPVAEAHGAAAAALVEQLGPYRVVVDASSATLGTRVRAAAADKDPFGVAFGGKKPA